MFDRISLPGSLAGLAVAATLAISAPMAQAATLGTFTHDYGSDPGKVDPGGNDTLTPDSVIVSDQSSSRFSDVFDFSSLSAAAITGFDLVLSFANAGPSLIPGELWSVRVQGSNSSSSLDDMFRTLADILSPQTFSLDGSTLLAGDAFAHSVATKTFSFWFSENTLFADRFALDSASLTVYGTPSAVPLPAGGLLLLGGLGGLAALRRARRTA